MVFRVRQIASHRPLPIGKMASYIDQLSNYAAGSSGRPEDLPHEVGESLASFTGSDNELRRLLSEWLMIFSETISMIRTAATEETSAEYSSALHGCFIKMMSTLPEWLTNA